MANETLTPVEPEEAVLQYRVPVRGESATTIPLNNTLKLLGNMAVDYLRRNEAASRMSCRTAPDDIAIG